MAYSTINDPSAYFQTALYTGNGTSTNAVTNTGNSNLKPDFLWLKSRSIIADHILFDSTRGTNKRLSSNTSGVEETQAFYSSFDTDGFTIGDSNANVNQNNATYVNWQWKANGGTTSSNTDGTITSTVQANTTSGFSIITYTGTGSNGTIGHGLNSAPEYWAVKPLTNVSDNQWFVCHKNINGTNTDYADYFIHWDTTGAKQDNNLMWNYTVPTNSVISLGSKPGTNYNGGSFVCYAFHGVQGYSKFNFYTGNGSADGPFIYTGFKPQYVAVKNVSATAPWRIYSQQISNHATPFNDLDECFFINTNEVATDTGHPFDFLANGFKVRGTNVDVNTDTNQYMYIAFADQSLVGTNDVIALAR